MGQTVLRVLPDEPARELDRFLHVAVRERGDECPLQQFGVARVSAQRFAKERGGRHRVAIGSGHQRREIIADGAVSDLEGLRHADRLARTGETGRGHEAECSDRCQQECRALAGRQGL